MKIALLGPTHPYRGGIAHYTTMLHRALRERGHDASLVSFQRLYPNWLFPGQSDKDPSLEPLTTDHVHYWIDALNPVTWISTVIRLRRSRPDLIAMSWWTTFLSPAWMVIGLLARIFVSAPLVFICHNVMPHEARLWDRWASQLVLGTGTGYIVQSDAERKRLQDLLPRAQPTVVPHPVYDMFAGKAPSRSAAREQLGLPEDAPVLLFFGIVREYKGLMDLLDAMPAIRAENGDVQLVIAGEFWEPRECYEQRIRDLEIESSVMIHDRYIPNEDVPTYFAAADLVVAPHRRATGSGVVQMAIGFGVPLVTTVTDHLREMDLRDSGITLIEADNHSLADAVVASLSPSSPLAPNHAGHQLASAFSWDRLVTALERLSIAQLPTAVG